MIRIFVAEDHHLVRAGLIALLAQEKSVVVQGEAADGLETVAKVRVLKPDILLLDLSLPRLHGLEVLNQLQSQKRTKVIVVTMHADEASVLEALRLGACGYVLKDTSSSDLILAIHLISKGECYVSSSLEPFLRRTVLDRQVKSNAGILTRREIVILPLVASGHPNAEIARSLNVSVRTVENHRANFMRKLHLRSQAEVVRYAIRHHFIEP